MKHLLLGANLGRAHVPLETLAYNLKSCQMLLQRRHSRSKVTAGQHGLRRQRHLQEAHPARGCRKFRPAADTGAAASEAVPRGLLHGLQQFRHLRLVLGLPGGGVVCHHVDDDADQNHAEDQAQDSREDGAGLLPQGRAACKGSPRREADVHEPQAHKEYCCVDLDALRPPELRLELKAAVDERRQRGHSAHREDGYAEGEVACRDDKTAALEGLLAQPAFVNKLLVPRQPFGRLALHSPENRSNHPWQSQPEKDINRVAAGDIADRVVGAGVFDSGYLGSEGVRQGRTQCHDRHSSDGVRQSEATSHQGCQVANDRCDGANER
mmetsp:Transcript_54164/g.156490  ORF Transcript_54164/g.156490 Transcript_54164/m.156490 type:complete len:324 (-) Transcript_54164:1187-2158(-)